MKRVILLLAALMFAVSMDASPLPRHRGYNYRRARVHAKVVRAWGSLHNDACKKYVMK
jgi:hypothetical protein